MANHFIPLEGVSGSVSVVLSVEVAPAARGEYRLRLWDDYGRNDFLADVESFEVSRFLHEIRGFGISVLYGTGLGFLQLNREVKQQLVAYLTSEPSSRTVVLTETKVVPRTNG